MSYDEEHIAALLRALPPPPPGWIDAAAELPAARRALAEIEQRLSDEPGRRAKTEELEAALAEAGYEPTPELVEALRRELRRPPAAD